MGENIMIHGMRLLRLSSVAEMIRNARLLQSALRTSEPREAIKRAGLMPVSREDLQHGNLRSSRLSNSGKARDRLLSHSYTKEDMEAAVFAWNHPERLHFSRQEDIGEGKDITDPSVKNNIKKKKSRGVRKYNIYEMQYKKVRWEVGMELHRRGFEQFYYIKRK